VVSGIRPKNLTRAAALPDSGFYLTTVAAFVDELDLAKLGFEGAETAATGRPAPDFKTIADFRRDAGPGTEMVVYNVQAAVDAWSE